MHEFMFYIAINSAGLEDIEYCKFDSENIIKTSISADDVENIHPLILQLNDELNLLIDLYEDEIIDFKLLSKAIQITENYLSKEKDELKKSSVLKFLSALNLALENNSPLLIWW